MSQLNNPMEILRLLDKSNCKKCGMPTCLAFAAAVFRGQQQLDKCPSLDTEIVERYQAQAIEAPVADREIEEAMEALKGRISEVDFPSAAERLNAVYSDDRLTFKCLGKDITVDRAGNLITDLHVHGWLAGPVLNYVLNCQGLPLSGKWVPLRELKGGQDWYRFFNQRCEKPMKKVADTYTDLFEDMIHIFNGKQVENHYESDISLVLRPLPRVPLLICYWKPEDELESDLNLFFDSTAGENLNIEALYVLITGMLVMFEKIALTHG